MRKLGLVLTAVVLVSALSGADGLAETSATTSDKREDKSYWIGSLQFFPLQEQSIQGTQVSKDQKGKSTHAEANRPIAAQSKESRSVSK